MSDVDDGVGGRLRQQPRARARAADKNDSALPGRGRPDHAELSSAAGRGFANSAAAALLLGYRCGLRVRRRVRAVPTSSRRRCRLRAAAAAAGASVRALHGARRSRLRRRHAAYLMC